MKKGECEKIKDHICLNSLVGFLKKTGFARLKIKLDKKLDFNKLNLFRFLPRFIVT